MAEHFLNRGFFFEFLLDANDLKKMGAIVIQIDCDKVEILENYEFPEIEHCTYDVNYFDQNNQTYVWLIPTCKHVPKSWKTNYDQMAFTYMSKDDANYYKTVYKPLKVFYLCKADALDSVWEKIYRKIGNNSVVLKYKPPSLVPDDILGRIK